jgi:hypothetical protein
MRPAALGDLAGLPQRRRAASPGSPEPSGAVGEDDPHAALAPLRLERDTA